jgi:hypothetical protein
VVVISQILVSYLIHLHATTNVLAIPKSPAAAIISEKPGLDSSWSGN